MRVTSVQSLELSGSPHARGYTHGRAAGGRLRDFLDDSLARLGHLADRPLDLDALRPAIADHRDVSVGALPELAEEIDGLADGADIERDAAWLLQLRREVLGYSRVTGGDCTTYASVLRPAGAGPDRRPEREPRRSNRRPGGLPDHGIARSCSVSAGCWATSGSTTPASRSA